MMTVKSIVLVMACAWCATAFRRDIKAVKKVLSASEKSGDGDGEGDVDRLSQEDGDEVGELMGFPSFHGDLGQSMMKGSVAQNGGSKKLSMKSGVDINQVPLAKGSVAVIVEADENSEIVQELQDESPGLKAQVLFQFEPQLEFRGGLDELRQASKDSLGAMHQWITKKQEELAAEHAGCKFHFCAHVGTTVKDREHLVDKDLMDNRGTAFLTALKEGHDADTFLEQAVFHYSCHRFATFMMKVYTGEDVPECPAEDIDEERICAASLMETSSAEEEIQKATGCCKNDCCQRFKMSGEYGTASWKQEKDGAFCTEEPNTCPNMLKEEECSSVCDAK